MPNYLVGNISGAALPWRNLVIQNVWTDGWNGSSSASSWTDLWNTGTVDMLGDALQTINARGQNCSIGHGMEVMTGEAVQSLHLWVQQLQASSAENVVLCQRMADLEKQAHQYQSRAVAYQKLEAQNNGAVNNAEVMKPGNHNSKWSHKAAKAEKLGRRPVEHSHCYHHPHHLIWNQESSGSEEERDTETLLSTPS